MEEEYLIILNKIEKLEKLTIKFKLKNINKQTIKMELNNLLNNKKLNEIKTREKEVNYDKTIQEFKNEISILNNKLNVSKENYLIVFNNNEELTKMMNQKEVENLNSKNTLDNLIQNNKETDNKYCELKKNH